MTKLIFTCLSIFLITGAIILGAHYTFSTQKRYIASSPNELWIEWDSQEGLHRLASSQAKVNYTTLLRYYESQMRGSYCGVATAVIALNALGMEAPQSEFLGKFRMFTQEEFFKGKVEEVVEKKVVEKAGLTLADMSRIMKTQPLTVKKYVAPYLTDEEIRTGITSALVDPSSFVIALYDRKSLKQLGNGHWSPIAAYDEESDSFLILDVARFKYPPYWVDAKTLFASMKTFDTDELPRGFIVLSSTR